MGILEWMRKLRKQTSEGERDFAGMPAGHRFVPDPADPSGWSGWEIPDDVDFEEALRSINEEIRARREE